MLLTKLSEVRKYAWGTASLAYLYHQLGMVCQVGVKQMVGYTTLLEGWIYEHFPTSHLISTYLIVGMSHGCTNGFLKKRLCCLGITCGPYGRLLMH